MVGAAHGIELPFVFDSFHDGGPMDCSSSTTTRPPAASSSARPCATTGASSRGTARPGAAARRPRPSGPRGRRSRRRRASWCSTPRRPAACTSRRAARPWSRCSRIVARPARAHELARCRVSARAGLLGPRLPTLGVRPPLPPLRIRRLPLGEVAPPLTPSVAGAKRWRSRGASAGATARPRLCRCAATRGLNGGGLRLGRSAELREQHELHHLGRAADAHRRADEAAAPAGELPERARAREPSRPRRPRCGGPPPCAGKSCPPWVCPESCSPMPGARRRASRLVGWCASSTEAREGSRPREGGVEVVVGVAAPAARPSRRRRSGRTSRRPRQWRRGGCAAPHPQPCSTPRPTPRSPSSTRGCR